MTQSRPIVYNGPTVCKACGYVLQYDVAHIRPVADFPLSATLRKVNDPNNLMALDKRCHWEYDNGYLELVDDKLIKTDKYYGV